MKRRLSIVRVDEGRKHQVMISDVARNFDRRGGGGKKWKTCDVG